MLKIWACGHIRVFRNITCVLASINSNCLEPLSVDNPDKIYLPIDL